MQHIGLICPEVSGHLNPMTTLGRELKRRGYEVSLVAKPDGRGKAEAAGLGYIGCGEAEFPAGRMAEITTRLGEMSGGEALRFMVEFFRQSAAVLLRDAPERLRAAGVDALLIDQTSQGASIAHQLDIPYVTVCCALALNAEPDVPPYSTPWPYDPTPEGRERNAQAYARTGPMTLPILEEVNAHRRRAGLPPLQSNREADSPLATIAQQPAFFDFPRRELPPTFHYTGPFHDEASEDTVAFPYEKLTGQPLLYASLGTLQNQQQYIFRIIAEACAGMNAQLVISQGRRDQAVLEDLPGAPLVLAYVPQAEMLKRAALTITHAGLNTVLGSLSRGVPMVAIPIASEQPGVAARLAHIGAGEKILLADLSADRLRAAVERVLTDPGYRRRAEEARREIERADGLRRAADIAERALSTRQTVLRDG